MAKKVSVTEDELLRRRTAHAEFLLSLTQDSGSVAAQTIAAYSDLLDEALLDVAVESHREARTGPAPAPPLPPPPLPPSAKPLERYAPPLPNGKPPPLYDVFGQQHPGTAKEDIICNECGRKLAAGVYARHLTTCLGMGRNATRAGCRRAGYGA